MAITKDTELLTPYGWKLVNKLLPNEKILTFDIKTQEVEFKYPNKIKSYLIENIYSISSIPNRISQNISIDSQLLIRKTKKGKIEIQSLSNVQYTDKDFIPVSGIKRNGSSLFTTLDKFLIQFTLNGEVQSRTKLNTTIIFKDVHSQNSVKLFKTLSELNIKIIDQKENQLTILVPNSLIELQDINYFNYLNLNNINYEYATTFLKYLTTWAKCGKDKKELGSYLYFTTKHSEYIGIIQALASISGMSVKIKYDDGYKLYISTELEKKCIDVKKQFFDYNDIVYNLEIPLPFLIRVGGNVSIIAT